MLSDLALATVIMASTAPVEPLVFVQSLSTDHQRLRLGDVADLTMLPPLLKERAAEIVVARLSRDEQSLSSRDLSARARAAMPGLAEWLPYSSGQQIHVTWSRAELVRAAPAAPVTAAPGEHPVRAGDALTIRFRIGAVTVEREVRALQVGRPGRKLFVRTPEGTALSVRLEPAS